jgi:hypothetical protein
MNVDAKAPFIRASHTLATVMRRLVNLRGLFICLLNLLHMDGLPLSAEMNNVCNLLMASLSKSSQACLKVWRSFQEAGLQKVKNQ